MKKLLLCLLLAGYALSGYAGLYPGGYNSSRLILLGKHLGQDLYALRDGVDRFGDNSVYVLINGKINYFPYSYRKVDVLQEGLNFLIDCSENGWYHTTSEKDYLIYKGVISNDTCLTHKDYVIAIANDSVAYWERSTNNGTTWERIENSHLIYTDSVAEECTVLYRNASIENKISPILTVQYIDAVPENVKTCVDNNTKTVDESITFTLDVPDHGYTYQWYKDGSPLPGATAGSYTIETIKSADAGSYTCRVSNACSESTSVAATLAVNKCPQIIDFPEFATVTYGCAPIELPATTNKGLTITYQSTNPSVAAVDGHTVAVVGTGEANIVASQPGSDDYLAATSITRTLHVNKIAQSISFEALPRKTYGDLPFTLPAESSAGLSIRYRIINPEVATISGSTVTIVGAGTTEIIASQEGDNLHNAAIPVTQTLTVDKAAQTITFAPFEKCRYGDPDLLLNEVTDKGLTISYASQDTTIARVSGNRVHINKVGNVDITATQPGNGNYLPAQSVTRTLTIVKAGQTIALGSIPNKTYGEADFDLPATTDKGLPIAYTSSDTAVAHIDGHTVHIEGVGTCQITAAQAGNDYYTAAASVTLPFHVAKAYQEITFAPLAECTFGTGSIVLTASSNSGVAIRFASSDTTVARIDGQRALIVGAGLCTITAYAEGNPNWYDATPVPQELRVAKATQDLTFQTPEPKTYGDAPFSLEATGTSGLGITFRSSDAQVLFIDGSTARITGAGDVTITAVQTGNDDYLPASSSATLHIAKAPLLLKAEAARRYYGDENPELTIAYSGFVNGDSENDLARLPQAQTDATPTSPAGTYDISIDFPTDRNYDISTQRGALTIEPAPLAIRAEDATKVYGDANPDFTFSYEGLKLNQTPRQALSVLPAAITPARTASPAGTYPIEVSGAASANYALTYEPGTLTVEKAPLEVSLRDETVSYGDEPQFRLYYKGWKLDDGEADLDYLPNVVTQATLSSYPGQYAVSLTGGLDDNYRYVLATSPTRYLTIEKATLDVYAPTLEKAYGAPNPGFTLSYEGFKNGETETDLERRPTAYCTADEASWYGEYPILLSGGYDSRYDLRLHDGVLTVVPAPTGLDSPTDQGNTFSLTSRDGLILLNCGEEAQAVDVFDTAGRRIASRRNVPCGETIIEVGRPGIYTVRIAHRGGVQAGKILID